MMDGLMMDGLMVDGLMMNGLMVDGLMMKGLMMGTVIINGSAEIGEGHVRSPSGLRRPDSSIPHQTPKNTVQQSYACMLKVPECSCLPPVSRIEFQRTQYKATRA